ncbi:ras protein [Mycena epipterygia]|nr:ras protein [Mycena epipterygia]
MDQWRIILLGDTEAGKTALAVQFTLNCFVTSYDPTLEEGYRKQFIVDNDPCFIEVCDTAGHEEYTTLRDQWIREGQGFFLMYSVTSRASFNQLDTLWQAVQRAKRDNVPLMVLGNQCDDFLGRVVQKEEGAALARRFGCPFLEVSAKTAQNVDRAFADLIRLLRLNKLGGAASQGSAGQKEKTKRKCVVL